MNGSTNESYIECHLEGGEIIDTRTQSWREHSELIRLPYFGGVKSVMLSKLPVKLIKAVHGDLNSEIVVPKGARVYHAVRSSFVVNQGKNTDSVLGICIGIVENGEVQEERFLNGLQHEVIGLKK